MTSRFTSSIKSRLARVVESHRAVHSAALFGSFARGDAEPHSDVDLLVVCDEGQKPSVYADLSLSLSSEFEKISICSYSPKELRFMAGRGSLFLLHLRDESSLLFDRTGLLGDILAGFEAKASYDEDFRESLRLMSPLSTAVSGAPNQIHRLSYIYSLFRVYGVYLLAMEGIFEFSKVRMAEALAQKDPAQAKNIAELSDLRVLNANFFTGSRSPSCAYGDVSRLQSSVAALGAVVAEPLTVTDRPYREAVAEFTAACCGGPRGLGYRLRRWFLLLVYDGLNLYSKNNHRAELTSFAEADLSALTGADLPDPVRRAATQSLNYMRNYHLKYVFAEERKIRSDTACQTLERLAATS